MSNYLDRLNPRRKRLTHRLKMMRERIQQLESSLKMHTEKHYRVCIFGSARIQPDDENFKMTYELAHLLGTEGIDVLTGGGPGLMEAGNKGVQDGRAEANSRSISFGLSIELGGLEEPSEHLDIKHHHKRFSSRLDDFMRLSNAIIVTPGGVGTLLELYFSWQLLQVAHLPERPIILIHSEFWKGLIDWMKEQQLANGLVSESDFRFIHLVDTPEQAHAIIMKEYEEFKISRNLTEESTQAPDSK